MQNTDFIKESILKAIMQAIDEEAKKCVNQAMVEYHGINYEDTIELMHELGVRDNLGKAFARYELEQHSKEILVMSLFGKGQKALISEFGRGSLMDMNNPALKDYINGDIFNKERLRHNMAIITRVKDDEYRDLDNNLYIRKRPKNEVNLEEKNPKRYAPIKPRYVLYSVMEQRLHSIMSAITYAVAKQVAFKKLIDGRKFKVTL